MKVRLCYKDYPFKMSLRACKAFYEETGLDLQTVFMTYISECKKTEGMELMERLVFFSKLYTRDIACKALYILIKEEQEGISLAEIQDATYRVSWLVSSRDDEVSEPWPIVMLEAALQINDYFLENLEVKKTDTLEG